MFLLIFGTDTKIPYGCNFTAPLKKFNDYDILELDFGTLILSLYCYCGNKIGNSFVYIKRLPVITWNRKHVLKQVVLITKGELNSGGRGRESPEHPLPHHKIPKYCSLFLVIRHVYCMVCHDNILRFDCKLHFWAFF